MQMALSIGQLGMQRLVQRLPLPRISITFLERQDSVTVLSPLLEVEGAPGQDDAASDKDPREAADAGAAAAEL